MRKSFVDCEKDLCITKKICRLRKKFVDCEKVLSIVKKFCAMRKSFVDCEKDLCITKKFCRLRKSFVDCDKVLSIVKKICASRKRFVDCEKDLCIAKKICRSGFNLFLCFARKGFRKYLHHTQRSTEVGLLTGETLVLFFLNFTYETNSNAASNLGLKEEDNIHCTMPLMFSFECNYFIFHHLTNPYLCIRFVPKYVSRSNFCLLFVKTTYRRLSS